MPDPKVIVRDMSPNEFINSLMRFGESEKLDKFWREVSARLVAEFERDADETAHAIAATMARFEEWGMDL